MKNKTLKDVMPHEFIRGEYNDTKAFKFKDVEVTGERSLSLVDDGIAWKPWPGVHKHVMFWVELANGYAVGFNENVSVGWSFPVIKL